ncbi:transglycosylase domain-containing protein, partial [[Clostridium] spiroforme]|nr:transglycosylase domain-containing protein [Thomasclavelia spiroformis]
AAEDSRFFEHNGFDLPRIIKAAFSNLVAGDITGGGSTITQQLIKKTYFPNAQQTYSRKLSEVILAIQADKELSKEEIITLYLNKIYFGRSTDSIGIAAACKYYFNKEVSELTLPEAAMLAGSLNSPYNYDPYYNLSKATNRRNTILDLMVKHGYITQEE